MPTASTHLEEQKAPAKSRPARERVLPVAQIYSVQGAEAQGQQAMVTLIIGDERTAPKKHGIRATRGDWVALVCALAEAHPQLGDELRDALHALHARGA